MPLSQPEPNLLSSRPLFQGPEPGAHEALRMIACARGLLDADDPELAISAAWNIPRDAPDKLAALILAGDLPPVAFEVLAGLTAIIQPKDYNMHPIWCATLELAGLSEKEPDEDELELNDHFLVTSERLASHESSPPFELVAVVHRVGPIGAGGTTLFDLAKARPVLWLNRHISPAWEALCMAVDAIGAGSFASLSRLGTIAEQNLGSPAIVWLDEIACRTARETPRVARREATLNALLTADTFGESAASIASIPRMFRKLFKERGDRAHGAWLQLAARPRSDIKEEASASEDDEPEDVTPDITPEEIIKARRAARKSRSLSDALEAAERWLEQANEQLRRSSEQAGPFYNKPYPPPEVRNEIDMVLHYMVMGFRQMYGLELLRDGLPRLATALSINKIPD